MNVACHSLERSVPKYLALKKTPTKSHHFIQSSPLSWAITAQFTPSLTRTKLPPSSRTPQVATGCQCIYTSRTHPAPSHLSARVRAGGRQVPNACTHTHTTLDT